MKNPCYTSNVLSCTLAVFGLLAAVNSHADMIGVNFSGDPALASSQSLSAVETAGFVPQGQWNNAAGISGRMALQEDPEGGIAIYFSSFVAEWQGFQTGSASISSAFGNQKMMRSSLVGLTGSDAVVRVSGVPNIFTTPGYALIVYCDSPNNTSDAVIQCSIDSGGKTQTIYLRDPGLSYAGSYTRAPFNSTADLGNQTPVANMVIFTGLNASDVAIALEPAASTPGAAVGLNGFQIVSMSKVQSLVPRITSPLSATAILNSAFAYTIQTDTTTTAYDAVGLPAGLVIDRVTGKISGTPTAFGTSAVTLKASNAAGTTTETLTLNVQLPPTQNVTLTPFVVPALLVQGTVGQTYDIQFVNALGNPNDWKTCGSLSLTAQAQFYVDLTATNAAKRFYRAVAR